MKRYRVVGINNYNYNYTLEDESANTHKISLQFYDTVSPQIGEYITFSENLLDKKANEGVVHFSFGKFSEIYGKNITPENMNENQNEILIIERNNQKLYLKRFYG